MNNDLLFPILPRDGKVPVNTDERVKKVSRSTHAKELGEEERFEHDEERRVARQQEREAHQQQTGHQQSKGQSDTSAESKSDGKAKETDDEPQKKGIKHLDIYI